MKKLQLAVALALMLTIAVVGSVSAADYSSQVTTAMADLVTDLTPTLLAIVVTGLGVIALFIGVKVTFKGARKIG